MAWHSWRFVMVGLVLGGAGPGCARTHGDSAATDTLTIGAYSVVREAFHEGLLPAFAAALEAQDRPDGPVRGVVQRLGRPEPARSPRGSTPTSRCSRSRGTSTAAGQGRAGQEGLEGRAEQGDDHAEPGRHRRPRGQSPGRSRTGTTWPGPDVGRPLPRPEDLRRRPLEHQRDLRRRAAPRPGRGGKPDPKAARDLLARVQANVVNMDASGRQSMATFERGTGDAIVTYENELLLQAQADGPSPLRDPAGDAPDRGPGGGRRRVGRAARQPRGRPRRSSTSSARTEGQRILVRVRLPAARPPTRRADPGRAPLPPRLFTMKDLGGWGKINKAVYDPGGVWDSTVYADDGRQGAMSRPSVAKHSPSWLLIRGATLSYLGVMVVLPLAVLTSRRPSRAPRLSGKRSANPFAWHALKLTFATAAGDGRRSTRSLGTATAWVLVRYPFPGKGPVNALIDLPFAVPTVVTGLMLVALYGPSSVLGAFLGRHGWDVIYQQPGIVLALLFVTYPFVIRSVQPVLLEMDGAEEEAAATLGAGPWTTFRRVTFPTLMPAIVTGAALSFSRALGEFGSVVMVAGNRPLATKTGPMYIFGEIESGNRHGAMVVSVVLLACSLGDPDRPEPAPAPGGNAVMAIETCLTPKPTPPEPRVVLDRRTVPVGRWLLIGAVLGWFAVLILVPAVALVRAALAGGFGPFAEALASPDAQRAFGLTLASRSWRRWSTRSSAWRSRWSWSGSGSGARRWPTAWWTCPSPSRRSSRG